jgi:hypothetical protein
MSDKGYGEGFHNGDPGHPVYLGNSEDNSMGKKYGGEPHTNKVYMLLKQIENKIFSSVPDRKEYFQEGDHCIEPFENWQNFCEYCQYIFKNKNGY